jgi:GH25 family lysozyme M1 (1,4-beta-N-acetylmuramidase)
MGRIPLALLVMAALVMMAVLRQLRQQPPADRSSVPPDTVTVDDGVNTVTITPHGDIPAATLSAEDFTASEDWVLYSGPSRQGIDVSEFQGQIDWEQAADSGVEFAFLRLGYRGSTEGGLYTDERFEENLAGAAGAGVSVGVYFFSQALDGEEAVREAEFVLDVLNGRTLDLPVMFDWEPVDTEGARTAGLGAQAVTECAAAFCGRIAETGLSAGVYFNRQQGYYVYDLSRLKDYVLWVSDPGVWPNFYYAVDVWQYSFSGTVPGIGAPVDRNIWFD